MSRFLRPLAAPAFLVLLAASCASDPPAGTKETPDPVESDGSGGGDGNATSGDGEGSGGGDGSTSGDGDGAMDAGSAADGNSDPGGDGNDWQDGDVGGDGSASGDGDGAPEPPADFTDTSRCQDANLDWRSGSHTWYISYPEEGSEECEDFSGCEYEGLFAACRGRQSREWVAATNIAAVFPGFRDLELHDLCVRKDGQYIVVTVYDTCGDQDCSGCCTRNKGDNDALIDLEIHTHDRFGAEGRDLEWADLGPTQGPGCESED